MDPEQQTAFLVLYGWGNSGARWWKLGASESLPILRGAAVRIQRSANSAGVLVRLGWRVLGNWRVGFKVVPSGSVKPVAPCNALMRMRARGQWSWEDSSVIPTVALPSRGGRLSCWCVYCDQFHHHERPNGHRVAHCKANTPYVQTGYVLRRDDGDTLAEMPSVIH